MSPTSLPIRGFLLHLTHYDPAWVLRKSREQPFDLDLALEIVEELSAQHFTMLLIGVSDGVRYESHPELARRYSVPMKQLETLAAHARRRKLETVPKLNFSRSAINCHNHWMRASGEAWHNHFDDEHAWRLGFDCIDEVIHAVRPARFLHIGMDEDHERSRAQYVAAIRTLRAGLKKRKLRTVAWSDSAIDYPTGALYREKSEYAEERLPKDTVRLLWKYWAVPRREIRRIRARGFELWGAPGGEEAHVRSFKKALARAGGTGMVMTRWVPCKKKNRAELLGLIRRLGPIYAGDVT